MTIIGVEMHPKSSIEYVVSVYSLDSSMILSWIKDYLLDDELTVIDSFIFGSTLLSLFLVLSDSFGISFDSGCL
jgi:hypothetical protein